MMTAKGRHWTECVKFLVYNIYLPFLCNVSIKDFPLLPWLVWLSGLSAGLQTNELLVWFPVSAHARVVGQVPSWGHVKGNHTLMFLSLSFSLPFPLSKQINKIFKKNMKILADRTGFILYTSNKILQNC